MKGNPMIFDQWVLQSVLEGNFVDTKNTAYDYDVTDKFTWNFKELVKIKQKKKEISQDTTDLMEVLLSKNKIQRGSIERSHKMLFKKSSQF
jgi:hypothetical protein